jgi:hypothetical protein
VEGKRFMANTALWDSVEKVLDATEELERIIDALVPGTNSRPVSTAIADLSAALSDSQAGFRRLLDNPDIEPDERADCEEAVEAMAGLTLRLEHTRRRLAETVARNRKRVVRRMLASGLLTGIVAYLVCSFIKAPQPGLHLLANAVVGLLIGIGFGLLFIAFFRWWDRPARRRRLPSSGTTEQELPP